MDCFELKFKRMVKLKNGKLSENFVFYKDAYPAQLWEEKGVTKLLFNRNKSCLEFCSTPLYSLLQFLMLREI